MIWLHLYNTTSSGDKGTLYAARNFLEARRITSDPMRNINAAADLISQYTTALVIAASMKYFGIDSVNDQPTRNQFQFGVHPDRSHYVNMVLEDIVNKYALPSINEMKQDTSKLSCPNCKKTYITQRGLQNHMKNIHPGIQEPARPKPATSKGCCFQLLQNST